jgi:TPR repeat protein
MITDHIHRLEERIENCNDGREVLAAHMLANAYDIGQYNVPQDSRKAHELWIRSAAMGSRDAHYNLSLSYGLYHKERGVEKNDKKKLYHLEEAAMLGDAASRCELGIYESDRGNWDKAKKHWMLSASAGCEGCLHRIKRGVQKGAVAKANTRTHCVIMRSQSS